MRVSQPGTDIRFRRRYGTAYWLIARSSGYWKKNNIRSYCVKKKKPGLYANIHAKKRRIKAGSKEKMRKPGDKGAPTSRAFKDSAKTAKGKRKK